MIVATGIAGAVLVTLVVAAAAAWVIYVNNVQQPTYDIVRSDGDIEVRDYPKLIVAEVLRSGGRQEAVRQGFRPLANYIFAKERAGRR